MRNGMIDGVIVKKLQTHVDDRGYFREIIKQGEDVFADVQQTSASLTNPGVIKAFHFHNKQDDIWYIAQGMARVVLYDQRTDSSTSGQTYAVVAGEENPLAIRIPKGVAHGYQVLGVKPVLLLYHTTKVYNAADPDEGRMAWDDPKIGFDWSVQNR